MPHRRNQSRSLIWVLFLGLIATPASAHKVQLAKDVGGTLHIQPNDTPRAGESTLAWFALTRKGGGVIPLEQCNCQLSVYSSTSASGSPLMLTPPLKAVSAERYQGIPGAEIQFPNPGAYQLQLSGTPKAGGNFQPFELSFEVTVAVGVNEPTANPQATQSSSPSTTQLVIPWQLLIIPLSAVIGLGILWGVWRRRK